MSQKLKPEDQPVTYYSYIHGLGPDELPLNSLVLDLAQPSAGDFLELDMPFDSCCVVY